MQTEAARQEVHVNLQVYLLLIVVNLQVYLLLIVEGNDS